MWALLHSLAAGLALGVVLCLGPSPARAEIIAYVDQSGRRIFVNAEDEELRQAAARGGAAAALRLLERRKRSLPDIDEHIEKVSRRHRVDPKLVQAIIEVESGWNPRARSHKGALGLMQLLPETGARFGARHFFNPQENVTAGVRYLRFLLDRFDNNSELALAAYNAGENAVDAAQGVPAYPETREYVKRVASVYGELGRSHASINGRIYAVVDESGRVIFINE